MSNDFDGKFPVVIVTRNGVSLVENVKDLPYENFIIVKTNAQPLHRVIAERTFNGLQKLASV